jgi:mannose-1-phosphate guanylyltransferase
MRALLLAAGMGTRLRPLTDYIPKCLVSIHGKPLLQIWLERLTEVHIGPFLINTHYRADQVREFIAQSAFKHYVTLIHELELLGTAGTLIANLDYFAGEDALVVHADNYCMADFSAFLKAHQNRPSQCVMTMMTFRTETPETCGILELDAQGVVVKMHEKASNPPGNLANGAIYILSAELLMEMKEHFANITDISTELIPSLMGKIYTFETRDTFLDIGTPEAYARCLKCHE